jgi:hypothetical protein
MMKVRAGTGESILGGVAAACLVHGRQAFLEIKREGGRQ